MVHGGLSRFVEVLWEFAEIEEGTEETSRHTHTHIQMQIQAHREERRRRRGESASAGAREAAASRLCPSSAADRFIEWHVPIRSNVVLCLPLSYPARGRFARRENYYRLCFTPETFALFLSLFLSVSPDFRAQSTNPRPVLLVQFRSFSIISLLEINIGLSNLYTGKY